MPTKRQLIESGITKIVRKVLNEDKLLATSPTIERITKLISDYYYGSTITLEQISDNPEKYDVYNKKGKIDGVYVVKAGNKYKFIDAKL